MTVRIVHKNSEAEDKRPSAGQLAKGEIAVNLHESGAFLSIKDTAGNVQQVGGVKVARNSPANPVKGTFWLDSDNNTLFIYDGTQWRGVTGGGGGGGGSINLAEGDAINITQAGSTYTINVVAGAGITLAGDNVAVELDTDATTVGLKMVGAGDAGKLSAKVATASTLGSVKVDDTTIKVSNDGELRAIVPDPLTYKGNINPTTEDSGADAIPTGSVGDAYTCSWGGTNVNGSLDNSPDWLSAIKGSDTTATLGDLLIINSGDGSGANQWTLVKTGTVDSGASIDVGDGTTASFPPNSPQEGDVWYNLNDARTYVYITDSSGDTVWVDISPQGNQTLWKKDSGNDIEPQTNTDDLKIPNLAGGTSTAGETLVMADSSGVLVSNAVGDGLEISSGKLQVKQDSTGTGVNLQTVTDAGNTTTNAIVINTIDTSNNTTAKGEHFFDEGLIRVQRPGNGSSQSCFQSWTGNQMGFQAESDGTTYIGNTASSGANTSTSKIKLDADGSVSLSSPKQGSTGDGVYIGPGNEAGNISQYSDDDSASSSGSRTTSFLSGWSGSGTKTLKYSIGHNGGATFAGSVSVSAGFSAYSASILPQSEGNSTFNIRKPGDNSTFRIMARTDGSLWLGNTADSGDNSTSNNANIALKGDGSAVFKSDVEITNVGVSTGSDTNSWGVAISPNSGKTGGQSYGNIVIQGDGRADGTADVLSVFDGNNKSINIQLNGTIVNSGAAGSRNDLPSPDSNVTKVGCHLGGGKLTVSRGPGSGKQHIWQGFVSNSATETSAIWTDGSAKFTSIEFPTGTSGGGKTVTSNTLDDYEEGSFTPTIDSVTSANITSANGRYTKIGQMVYAKIFIQCNASGWGGTATDTTIGGLPFTVKNSIAERGGGFSPFQDGLNKAVNFRCVANTTNLVMFDLGTSARVQGNDFTGTNTTLEIVVIYAA